MTILAALLDMDGTIVDFTRGALAVHGISRSPYEDGHYGNPLLQRILGMEDSEFGAPMDEGFWAGLPWTQDGEEILRLVEARFGRENIVICTSPMARAGCWDGKRRWIERHMPAHYHRVENQMFAPQKHIGANSETILVDDFDKQVDRFRATRGGHVCHVPRPWNRLHPLADRASVIVREVLSR